MGDLWTVAVRTKKEVVDRTIPLGANLEPATWERYHAGYVEFQRWAEDLPVLAEWARERGWDTLDALAELRPSQIG